MNGKKNQICLNMTKDLEDPMDIPDPMSAFLWVLYSSSIDMIKGIILKVIWSIYYQIIFEYFEDDDDER